MSNRREVWKIGGSVLNSAADYSVCADQICRHIDAHPRLERLYVVISAAFGVTDKLVSAAGGERAQQLDDCLQGKRGLNELPDGMDSPRTAMQLLQGELDSVHALRCALLSRGVQAKSCTQCDFFPVVATGSYLRAIYDPGESAARFKLFEQICDGQRVVILSGFGGVNPRNQPVILGRNASDYVAGLLSAHDPQVENVTFIKESGAIFINFESPDQQALQEVDSGELWREEFEELLDQRVLTAITCDFRVCGLSLEGGTWVRHRPGPNAREAMV